MFKLKKISLLLVVMLLMTTVFSSLIMAASNDDFYVVQKGDVLWKIAKKYDTDWQTLAKYNNLKNPNLIFPGEKIYIPGKEEVAIKNIDIYSTNDFHGSLEGGYEAGAAKLKAYMDYYKAKNENGTVILSGGDNFQGTPMSNLLYGKPVVEMMNAIGYDATAVGNHEFDWGIDKVNESMKDASFESLAANIYKDGNVVEWAKPYTIVEKNGLKVGIIGLSTLETPSATLHEHVKDYTFENPIDVANKLVPEVRKAGAEIVVIAAHIGGNQDSETKEITGDLADLANGVKGVDAIIGGHSHSTISGEVNGIPVVMAYKNGRMIGHISLQYNTKNKKVVAQNVDVIEVRKGELDVEVDAEVQAMVDAYAVDLEPIFGQVLGSFTDVLTKEYNETSPAGNWFTDVMREYAKVDIALTNAGGIRSEINAGEVTMEEVYTIMPFDNTIVDGKMTGAQILEILEHGASLEKGMIQVSGLTFEYDSTKPVGERVVSVTMADGSALDPTKTYTVATNDFLSTGFGDGYTTFGEVEWNNPYYLLRDGLKADIEAKGEMVPDTTLRAKDISQEVSLGFDLPLAA